MFKDIANRERVLKILAEGSDTCIDPCGFLPSQLSETAVHWDDDQILRALVLAQAMMDWRELHKNGCVTWCPHNDFTYEDAVDTGRFLFDDNFASSGFSLREICVALALDINEVRAAALSAGPFDKRKLEAIGLPRRQTFRHAASSHRLHKALKAIERSSKDESDAA